MILPDSKSLDCFLFFLYFFHIFISQCPSGLLVNSRRTVKHRRNSLDLEKFQNAFYTCEVFILENTKPEISLEYP